MMNELKMDILANEMNGISVLSICDEFGLKHIGENVVIDGLALLGRESSKKSVMTYATGDQFRRNVEEENNIKVLIIPPKVQDIYEPIIHSRKGGIIASENPEKDFYRIHKYLVGTKNFYKPIVETKRISSFATVHPTAIIEDNVIIDDGVTIGPYSWIRKNSIIRAGTYIGANTIIGSEGFQVVRIDGKPECIAHCGGVLVGENVSIGDNCTISNNLFDGFTKIGNNTKIDNFCSIAHYVTIGSNVVITAKVTIVGSVTIEDDCYIGAGAILMNHVTIHKGATVGLGSVVMGDVSSYRTVVGNPAFQIK